MVLEVARLVMLKKPEVKTAGVVTVREVVEAEETTAAKPPIWTLLLAGVELKFVPVIERVLPLCVNAVMLGTAIVLVLAVNDPSNPEEVTETSVIQRMVIGPQEVIVVPLPGKLPDHWASIVPEVEVP